MARSTSNSEVQRAKNTLDADADRALAVLEALASRGISLSIDDFGTGYSSMAYLKRLPVSVIKIDRTFVTRMDTDASDATIVRSSLELARNLDLTVVAEGVETQEVWDQLRDLGCPVVQGYFLSRPLPAAEVFGWITSRLSSIES